MCSHNGKLLMQRCTDINIGISIPKMILEISRVYFLGDILFKHYDHQVLYIVDHVAVWVKHEA